MICQNNSRFVWFTNEFFWSIMNLVVRNANRLFINKMYFGGTIMNERRKTKRSELSSRLIIKQLDGSGEQEVAIEVEDISKTGIGFTSIEALTIGTVYEGYLTIWTKEVIHAVLEIVRIEKKGDTISYGASFVGMPELDAFRIETYQTVEQNS